MPEIVLSDQQASILMAATGPVAVRRPDGTFVGWVSSHQPTPASPFTPEEMAAAEAAARGPGPWYTTQEVLAHLRTLDRSAS
jgi:hypothetical protein